MRRFSPRVAVVLGWIGWGVLSRCVAGAVADALGHSDVLWRRHHGGSSGLIEFELAIQAGRGSCWQADLVERVDRERLRCNVPDGPRSTYSLTPFPS